MKKNNKNCSTFLLHINILKLVIKYDFIKHYVSNIEYNSLRTRLEYIPLKTRETKLGLTVKNPTSSGAIIVFPIHYGLRFPTQH
jgi:hypothetical protein